MKGERVWEMFTERHERGGWLRLMSVVEAEEGVESMRPTTPAASTWRMGERGGDAQRRQSRMRQGRDEQSGDRSSHGSSEAQGSGSPLHE